MWDSFSNLTLGSDLAGLQTVAVMLPGIFFAVAALVLNVLMVRMAAQQRLVSGTLKALGYSNREVFSHYIKFGAACGLAGAAVGAILGEIISRGFTAMYAKYYVFPSVPHGWYPGLQLASAVAAVVVAVLGSLRGADGGGLQANLFQEMKEIPIMESFSRVRAAEEAVAAQMNTALGTMAVRTVCIGIAGPSRPSGERPGPYGPGSVIGHFFLGRYFDAP